MLRGANARRSPGPDHDADRCRGVSVGFIPRHLANRLCDPIVERVASRRFSRVNPAAQAVIRETSGDNMRSEKNLLSGKSFIWPSLFPAPFK